MKLAIAYLAGVLTVEFLLTAVVVIRCWMDRRKASKES